MVGVACLNINKFWIDGPNKADKMRTAQRSPGQPVTQLLWVKFVLGHCQLYCQAPSWGMYILPVQL